MNCSEIDDLIHPYIDGELDLMRSLEVEQHLAQCQACTAAHARHLALRAAVRKHASRTAPTLLREQVLAAVRSEGTSKRTHVEDVQTVKIAPQTTWRLFPYIAWAAAACIAMSGMLAWQLLREPSASALLTKEIVSNHIRSLLADQAHLTDVASTDQHTVKPWFAGRLDFSPRVQDFAEEGFPLIGGRLDYLDGRSVAALIYRRNKHFINVFVWPAADDKQVTPLAREESRGYHVAHFVDDGLNYFAVSDVDPAELDRLMRLIEQPTTRPSAPEPH